VPDLTNDLCVFPCIDHEPYAARADGNHGTGLERFLTGYVGGSTSFLTYVNYGLRARVAEATANGQVLLPAFSLGDSGMSSGTGAYAAYRAPVLEGDSFDRFGFNAGQNLPPWAAAMALAVDERLKTRLHPELRSPVATYQQTREATEAYGAIFNSDLLKIGNGSTEVVDGISNADLELMLGDDGAGRRAALALRLFHYGCPAVFFNEGGYDLHSDEETMLPVRMEGPNRLISGLNAALKRMSHPEGGTYWDKTLVVFGSEFGRSTGGNRFNSARGSDHGGDYSTRWMSMPLMGGVVISAGKGGRMLGQTAAADLRPLGQVHSYRSMLKTLMHLLGADHAGIFPADAPIQELFA
jgi:hypothetical protein